jgi:predicted metalloprotease
MGRTLFQDLLRRFDDGGIAILAVIAHEFSHIAQYRRRVFDTLVGGSGRAVRAELHADFMTGYYLGLRKADNPSLSIRTAGVALYQIGDYAFNNRDHHGTPAQRVAAAEEGFKLANNKRSFVNAFNEGVNWILATHKE